MLNLKQTLLLLFLLVTSIHTATFSINSVSSCTATNPTGFCTRWEQNGSVTETTSCFPAGTQLYVLEDGQEKVKDIERLKLGELVLGRTGYSEFLGWLHWNGDKVGEYLRVETQGGEFMVSSHHNIGLQDGSYAFAGELMGKILHSGHPVTKLTPTTAKGIYAPMTKSGTFYIRTSSSTRTLAHCFANIRNPDFYQPIVTTLWQAWELFFGPGNSESTEIHPAASWMIEKFGFLMEQ